MSEWITTGLMLTFFTCLAIINYFYPEYLYPDPRPLDPVDDDEAVNNLLTANTKNGGGLRRWFNEKKMSSGKLTGALFAVISALIYSVYRSAQTFLLLTSS